MFQHSSNCLTLCPQCNNYPLLFSNKDNIMCYQCGYNQYTSLHKYLEQI